MTSQVVKRKSPSAPSKKPGTLSLRPLVKDLPFLFLALALAFAVALPPCSGSYNGFVKTKPANATKSNITTYLNNTEVQQICSAACAGTAGNGSLGAHLGLGLNGSALNKTHTSRKSSPVCLADCTTCTNKNNNAGSGCVYSFATSSEGGPYKSADSQCIELCWKKFAWWVALVVSIVGTLILLSIVGCIVCCVMRSKRNAAAREAAYQDAAKATAV